MSLIVNIPNNTDSSKEISQQVGQYNDLVDGSEIGELSYVENSQGTSWLPGTLGGTYFPKGWYRWDGTNWVSDRNTIADQFQNILNSLLGKVDKSFLGWVQYSDTEFTTTNRKIILSNTRTKLTNNAGNVLNIVGMFGGDSIWDSVNNKLTPDNSGDTYDWRVQFTVDPTLNNRNLSLELDIGGDQGVIWDKTLRLARGAGVDTRITESLDVFTLGTFVANGGELYIICDGDIEIYNTVFKIERKFRNN